MDQKPEKKLAVVFKTEPIESVDISVQFEPINENVAEENIAEQNEDDEEEDEEEDEDEI